MKLKQGDIVIFKTPKEIEKEYGEFNDNGFIRVGTQSYSKDMYEKYKNYLYSIQRVEDDRVIFYKDNGSLWERITVGMLKKIYKIKRSKNEVDY